MEGIWKLDPDPLQEEVCCDFQIDTWHSYVGSTELYEIQVDFSLLNAFH